MRLPIELDRIGRLLDARHAAHRTTERFAHTPQGGRCAGADVGGVDGLPAVQRRHRKQAVRLATDAQSRQWPGGAHEIDEVSPHAAEVIETQQAEQPLIEEVA